MIPTFNSPEDLLAKLYREGRRLWTSKDQEEAADHLFNFCVTSVALRDWIIKYLALNNSDKDAFQKSWRNTPPFGLCADIANSLKHFRLDHGRETNITDVQSYQETLVTTDLNYNKIEGVTTQKPFFKILVEDGSETDLFKLLVLSIKNWEDYFEKYKIPKKSFPNAQYVFVEMYHP